MYIDIHDPSVIDPHRMNAQEVIDTLAEMAEVRYAWSVQRRDGLSLSEEDVDALDAYTRELLVRRQALQLEDRWPQSPFAERE